MLLIIAGFAVAFILVIYSLGSHSAPPEVCCYACTFGHHEQPLVGLCDCPCHGEDK